TLFKKVSKIVLDRHKKSETYKQVSDCLSSEGSVNRSLSDLHCGTVREFHEKIQPELVVSRNKPSRDFLLKLVGLKPARKIYPRKNFSFFTFFALPASKFKVTTNTLSTLQGRLGTSECFSQTAQIGFIGQGMVAEKGIKLEYYENMLRTLIEQNGADMIYFPHRTEKEFVKKRLKQIEGLSYHESSMPLELEIAQEKITLSKIYGIASTASISLEKLYPSIPVINLNIPIQHYMVEAFGINFHNVAKQLNLRSLDLE
ncbi:hypothetical protein QO226_22230, partial [Vibrio vulnificus]|uniref:hypothetical protein n=4 Tax=Vibrio vulnificus TaxID=672 RepID=UPI0024DFFED0